MHIIKSLLHTSPVTGCSIKNVHDFFDFLSTVLSTFILSKFSNPLLCSAKNEYFPNFKIFSRIFLHFLSFPAIRIQNWFFFSDLTNYITPYESIILEWTRTSFVDDSFGLFFFLVEMTMLKNWKRFFSLIYHEGKRVPFKLKCSAGIFVSSGCPFLFALPNWKQLLKLQCKKKEVLR